MVNFDIKTVPPPRRKTGRKSAALTPFSPPREPSSTSRASHHQPTRREPESTVLSRVPRSCTLLSSPVIAASSVLVSFFRRHVSYRPVSPRFRLALCRLVFAPRRFHRSSLRPSSVPRACGNPLIHTHTHNTHTHTRARAPSPFPCIAHLHLHLARCVLVSLNSPSARRHVIVSRCVTSTRLAPLRGLPLSLFPLFLSSRPRLASPLGSAT